MPFACVMWNCKCASDACMLGYNRLPSIEGDDFQHPVRKGRGLFRPKVIFRIVIGLFVWGSIVGGTALAGSGVIPVAGGGGLQAQVKGDAAQGIPPVVRIASAGMV